MVLSIIASNWLVPGLLFQLFLDNDDYKKVSLYSTVLNYQNRVQGQDEVYAYCKSAWQQF